MNEKELLNDGLGALHKKVAYIYSFIALIDYFLDHKEVEDYVDEHLRGDLLYLLGLLKDFELFIEDKFILKVSPISEGERVL